jgi:dCTP deaminase
MVLCDVEIQAALRCGALVIEPRPNPRAFTTTAVDLLLGDEFKRWKTQAPGAELIIDPSAPSFSLRAIAEHHMEPVPFEQDGSILLRPKEFILAITRERVELPVDSRLAARVEGRSTLARLGLSVHITAPTIHSGFRGQITLEMANHGQLPLRLRPGLNVCQLIVEQVFGTPGKQMAGPFQDQIGVTGSS